MPEFVIDGTGIYKCFHSLGAYNLTGSANAVDPSAGYCFTGTALTPAGPCTAAPNTHGTPPCVPIPLLGTGILKTDGGIPAVTAIDIQLSPPLGLPLVLQSAGKSVNAVF